MNAPSPHRVVIDGDPGSYRVTTLPTGISCEVQRFADALRVGESRARESDETVAAAIADAKRLEISDPKAWITARLAKAANDSSDFYASIDRTFGAAQQGR